MSETNINEIKAGNTTRLAETVALIQCNINDAEETKKQKSTEFAQAILKNACENANELLREISHINGLIKGMRSSCELILSKMQQA